MENKRKLLKYFTDDTELFGWSYKIEYNDFSKKTKVEFNLEYCGVDLQDIECEIPDSNKKVLGEITEIEFLCHPDDKLKEIFELLEIEIMPDILSQKYKIDEN